MSLLSLLMLQGRAAALAPPSARSRLPAVAGYSAIPLSGRFEAIVRNERQYGNPFTDVSLGAVFTSPSGRHVRFSGFYDCDGRAHQEGSIWKLRLMSDEPGTWTNAQEGKYITIAGNGLFPFVYAGSTGAQMNARITAARLAQGEAPRASRPTQRGSIRADEPSL